LFDNGYEMSKIHYLPNGVPLNRHVVKALKRDDPEHPTPWQKLQSLKEKMRERLANDYPIMSLPSYCQLAVFTGRLHENKGLGDLIRAWRMVVSKLEHVRLWLVGSGDYEPELRKLIVQHNLQGYVQLTGAMPRVDRILAAADLFILPSFEEGMSMALLEAMATRLPVIVSDIPGNRELIEHEIHGLRVPLKKTEKLAQAISNVLNSAEFSDELGKNAFARIRQKYSISHIAEKHIKLFEKEIEQEEKAKSEKESSKK
jgi:glycosyltransferase involved in cell wall biosynthesis